MFNRKTNKTVLKIEEPMTQVRIEPDMFAAILSICELYGVCDVLLEELRRAVPSIIYVLAASVRERHTENCVCGTTWLAFTEKELRTLQEYAGQNLKNVLQIGLDLLNAEQQLKEI